MAPRFLDLFKPKPAAEPEPPDDRYARALQLQQEGRLGEAIELLDAVIARQPNHAEAHYKRANALNNLQRPEEALAGYDQAVRIDAKFANAWCNRGSVLEQLRRWEEALESYEQAIALNPTDALACYNRGSVLSALRRFDAALASYEQAVALRPDYAEAYVNRGHVLQELERFEEAVASYDKAIELAPVFHEAFSWRGIALQKLNRNEEANESIQHANDLKSDYAGIYAREAAKLADQRRFDDAIALFERAVGLEPNRAESHYNLGVLLVQQKRYEEGIASYDRAFALDPFHTYLMGARQYARMHVCDWSNLQSNLEQLRQGLEARRAVTVPMPVMGLLDSPSLHRLAAEIFVREDCPRDDSLGVLAPHPRSGRIRVGYFSADFRIHPVSLLTAELFERHDRSRFELFGFAFGPDSRDHVRARLLRAFDHFTDVDRRSDVEVATLARSLAIDIAVDLTGFTTNQRCRIFALRAAPVQVSYLGYPGTLGNDYMDYLLADRVLVPEGSEPHYTEKIIRLPDCYQPNDSQREIGKRDFSRQELELPAEGFVFCCFNRPYKMTPDTFDSWMRILKRVPGSVLWLSEGNASVVTRLRQEAQARGIDGGRLVFAKSMTGLEHHLARHRAAGLFLDTLPFNAHTTASDALWAGLPVLTCIGEAIPGRVAASLLTAIGLSELITRSPAEYEELAVRLATEPAELARVRDKLARNRLSTPLFDTTRYARNLEAAYEQIYERSQSGLAPEHIFVGS